MNQQMKAYLLSFAPIEPDELTGEFVIGEIVRFKPGLMVGFGSKTRDVGGLIGFIEAKHLEYYQPGDRMCYHVCLDKNNPMNGACVHADSIERVNK